MSKIKRKKWTEAEFQKLIELKQSGKSIETIAKILGRTPMSVSVKCSTIGISYEGGTSPQKKSKQKSTKDFNKEVQDLWFQQHKSVEEIADITDTYALKVADTIKRMIAELHYSGEVQKKVIDIMDPEDEVHSMVDDGAPFFWDQTNVPDDPEALIQAYETMRQQVVRYEKAQSEVTIQINTELEWIALLLSGDMHIGHMTTDLTKISNDMKLIRDTPGMYYGFMGDAIEGFTRATNLSGLHEQLLSPKGCRKLYDHFMDIVSKKLLFTIRGCHDDFAVNATDSDHIEETALKLGKPYLGYGGKVNLLLNNEVVYKVAAWHKRGGNSYHNIFYPCTLYLQRYDMDADVVAIAHNHVVGITKQAVQERPRVFIRTGVYKQSDRFSKKLGFKALTDNGQDIEDVPVVLLNTKTKEMRIANSLQEAKDMLKVYNAKEPTKKSVDQKTKGKRKSRKTTN